MTVFPNEPGVTPRVLLLGGTSEIGLAILAALGLPADAEVILAGRDEQRLAAAGKELPGQVRTVRYDALDTGGHQAFVDGIFAGGHLDLAISAAGILVPQADCERDVRRAATMIETDFTGHVSTLLAVAARMRAQGRGTIVVLSSVAAVRPRKANPVYGAAKAGLDAFARGFADSLHGSGVRVLLVRPGFVTGRMTAGMRPAPLATTPEAVGAATAAALRGNKESVWVPACLAGLAIALRLVPRPVWRRIGVLASRGTTPRGPPHGGVPIPPYPLGPPSGANQAGLPAHWNPSPSRVPTPASVRQDHPLVPPAPRSPDLLATRPRLRYRGPSLRGTKR
jgi:decaprenylphospho-beta-D-erythro-pentofuranosid-2-ulose 2-reductase